MCLLMNNELTKIVSKAREMTKCMRIYENGKLDLLNVGTVACLWLKFGPLCMDRFNHVLFVACKNYLNGYIYFKNQ